MCASMGTCGHAVAFMSSVCFSGILILEDHSLPVPLSHCYPIQRQMDRAHCGIWCRPCGTSCACVEFTAPLLALPPPSLPWLARWQSSPREALGAAQRLAWVFVHTPAVALTLACTQRETEAWGQRGGSGQTPGTRLGLSFF